jgi:cell wall-associated NlpC family hydrolase
MTDRRLLRSNGQVAHLSLTGLVTAERFVEGTTVRVACGVADLLAAPGGARDRQLVLGEAFRLLDPGPGDFAFGFAEKDGYCGYLRRDCLRDSARPTHRVAVRQTYAKPGPDLKSSDPAEPIHFGSQLTVTGEVGAWSGILAPGDAARGQGAPSRFVPTAHLAPLGQADEEPVAVARRFLGTPYLWGGNSAFGIDCSGLIQAAMLACGWACPGDSDLQAAMPGLRLAEGVRTQAGDLIFWKGHVAMATGPDSMIHANAHHMMVVEEPMAAAALRIAAGDTGPVTLRLRPERHPAQPL